MENKNKEQSDVLSYSLDTNITTKGTITDLIESNYIDYGNNNNYEYSSVLNSFYEFMPSKTVKEIDDGLLEAKKLLDDSKKEYSGNYFTSDNKEEIKVENENDINGDSHLESLIEIETIYNEVTKIKENFMSFIYGKDVDEVGASDIDKVYFEKMQDNERENSHHLNNYYNIYNDIQISYLIRSNCSRMLLEIIDLHSLKNKEKSEIKIGNSEARILDRQFKLECDKTNVLQAKNKENFKNSLATMNNIFKIKNDMNIYNETFSNLFNLDTESYFFADFSNDINVESETYMHDLVKTLMGNSKNKEKIKKNILKKAKIRSFF